MPSGSEAKPPPSPALHNEVGDDSIDEIRTIFASEFDGISADLKLWIPQWAQERANSELLTDIRRALHTAKGGARMIGVQTLGDYAWAHEDLLNRVLEGRLPRSNALVTLLQRIPIFLEQHKHVFLSAESASNTAVQAEVHAEINAVAQLMNTAAGTATALSATALIPSTAQSITPTPVANSVTSPVKPYTKPGIKTFAMPFDEAEENRMIWEMFREELPEQLQVIDRSMQDLHISPQDSGAVRSLERALHTVKGGARMARLNELGDAAHQAEESLATFTQAGKQHKSAAMEALQGHMDTLSMLAEQSTAAEAPSAAVASEDLASPVATAEPAEITEADAVTAVVSALIPLQTVRPEFSNKHYGSYLEQMLDECATELPDISVLSVINEEEQAAQPEVEEGVPPLMMQEQIRLSAGDLDKMIDSANMLNVQQNTLGERLQVMAEDVGEFGRTAARLKHLLRSLELETEAQVHAGYNQSAAAKQQVGNFDPLEMDEYSEIQRLSRALAESLNDLVNIEGDLSTQLRSASRFVKQGLSASRDLHHDLLATRLVEVSVLAPRLRRILRQTAAELGQKAELELSGETLKLDRHLLQRMTAPIEHLLRNAVSHGIETEAEREQLGKPPLGNIALKVYREDTEVVFRISDDGRGLDSKLILAKAHELGLVGSSAMLSEQEMLRLILRPGFTTAQQISQIAGRGVGMDVVNSEVKAMGGNVLIDSTLGTGTVFTIRLPFTMAVNPVLFTGIQEQSYAIPLGNIQGLSRVDAATLQQHLGSKDTPLAFNDEDYPVHYLGAALGHAQPLSIKAETMYTLVYTRVGGYRVAWVVDAVHGRRDVILQSLGAMFKTCYFYSAATITSDGQVVMVPDMLALTESVLTAPDQVASNNNKTSEPIVAAKVQHEFPHIMVVDDSITVRKVTEKLLLHENYVVETAKDGLEALEKLDGFEPDLILLDIEMPRMDGFEVLGAVRGNERWHGTPVIMISSRTAEKHRAHAAQLGASAFLGKPYQSQALLEHIKKHLHTNHLPINTVSETAGASA